MQKDMIKLIFKSKEFSISSNFCYFNDIKPDIYQLLTTNHQYEVQSNVSEEVFKSFLDYWLTKKLPSIDDNNINEYVELSEEFNLMQDLIQIYQQFTAKITNLEKQLSESKLTIQQNSDKYDQIVDILFENPEIKDILMSDIIESRRSFYHQDIDYIQLITKQKVEINGIIYIINDDDFTCGIIVLKSDEEDAFIPRTIQYQSKDYIITAIHKKSFSYFKKSITFSEDSEIQIIDDEAFYHSGINVIEIPKKVKRIGKKAFEGCKVLKKIGFSENSELEIIDDSAFQNSGLNCIAIPPSVKQIGDYAFSCNLNKIEFSSDSKLEKIGKFAFETSNIESFQIPPNVQQIGEGSFRNTKLLKNIQIMKGNCHFSSIENDKFIVKKSDSKSEDFDAIIFANRDIEEVNIPSNIKRIEYYSFNLCEKLQKVTFSEDSELEFIGEFAFSESGLKSIILPPKVSSLDRKWFSCSKLSTVKIMKGNCHFSSIENDNIIVKKSDSKSEDFDVIIFANRDIEEVNIPSNIKRIDYGSFNLCEKLQKVTFSEKSELEYIGRYAFSETGIQSLFISPTVKLIDKGAFSNCNELQEVTFSNDSQLQTIEENAFSCSSIVKIEIPSNLTTIGKRCFESCNELTEVKIPNNSKLKIIGKGSFSASSITSITIPKHVTIIKKFAFDQCINLKNVEFSEDSELQIIEEGAFSSCIIETFKIPAHVKQIGISCFCGCENLQEIIISDNSELEIIECGVLESLKIQNITIPPHLKRLNHLPTTITHVDFSKNNNELKILGDFAFSDSNIKEIVIPSSVTTIEANCFHCCYDLEKVEFAENSQLKLIDIQTFSFSGIKSIIIPPHVIGIKSEAFFGCKKLESVTFAEGSELSVIEKNAFADSSIKHLSIPAGAIYLQDGWIDDTPELIDIKISPENKVFSNLNDQIILKKSTENGIFDIVTFVSRNCNKVKIPSYIKIIGIGALYSCVNVGSIEFENDSKLELFSENSFSKSGIEFITIPSHINHIGKWCFSDCDKLKKIDFEKNSELKTLDEYALSRSSIESLSIPSSIVKFGDGWCFLTPELKNITIIPNGSENICYFDNKFILGKMDLNQSYFDTIVFVRRDIEKVKIPHFIKKIEPYAFNNCLNLYMIEFEKNSQLKIIGGGAFSNNSDQLSNVEIPSSVEIIEWDAFQFCHKLKCVTFSQDSNLNEIGKDALCSCSIRSLYIPPKVTKFNKFIYDLHVIEFDENTELTKINVSDFIIEFVEIEIIVFAPQKLQVYCNIYHQIF